jgi:hypothetical protein
MMKPDSRTPHASMSKKHFKIKVIISRAANFLKQA